MRHGVATGCGICLIFLMIAVSAAWASPVAMLDVHQYRFAPNHIQAVISLDRAVAPSYHFRTNPDRFVLEIPNCQPVSENLIIPFHDAALQRIRVQRLNSGTSQVVFDLIKKIDASVQVLSQTDNEPARVIVDLFDASMPAATLGEQQQVPPDPEQQHYVVVLDPGHGGRDPGAVGPTGLKEKEVVLDLARRMRKLLRKSVPELSVFLTREDDTFLSLSKRTEIANEYHADLFISLHVNANPSRRVHGFSVYTLAENATDAAARELAEKENAADLLFGDVETPTPTENDFLLKLVLADLSTTKALEHSLHFGQIALNTAVANLQKYTISNEGLKRANFAVLRSAAMPSVLVEACYASNKQEEKLLKRKDFRQQLATSLAESVRKYFANLPETPSAHLQMAQLQQPSSAFSTPGSSPVNHKLHVVKSGESLSVIAGKYDVNLSALRQMNRLAVADLIYVGQKLWIP